MDFFMLSDTVSQNRYHAYHGHGKQHKGYNRNHKRKSSLGCSFIHTNIIPPRNPEDQGLTPVS